MPASVSNIGSLIKKRVSAKDPFAEVILYGSRARGDASKDSDWDILILTDQPILNHLHENEYRNELFELALETGEPFSTIILSKKDWHSKYSVTPLYINVQTEGILL